MTWTEPRVERLKKLWAEGLSATETAIELGGVTRNAVIGKICRLGLAGRKVNAAAAAKQKRERRPRRVAIPRARLETGQLEGAPIPEPVVASTKYFRLLPKLTDHSCRWPCWGENVPASEQFFCGTPTASVYEGRVYCGLHSSMSRSRVAYNNNQSQHRTGRFG